MFILMFDEFVEDKSQFSLEITRNFCSLSSFQHCCGELIIGMKSNLFEMLYDFQLRIEKCVLENCCRRQCKRVRLDVKVQTTMYLGNFSFFRQPLHFRSYSSQTELQMKQNFRQFVPPSREGGSIMISFYNGPQLHLLSTFNCKKIFFRSLILKKSLAMEKIMNLMTSRVMMTWLMIPITILEITIINIQPKFLLVTSGIEIQMHRMNLNNKYWN